MYFVKAHAESELPDLEWIHESAFSLSEVKSSMLVPEHALLECLSAFAR